MCIRNKILHPLTDKVFSNDSSNQIYNQNSNKWPNLEAGGICLLKSGAFSLRFSLLWRLQVFHLAAQNVTLKSRWYFTSSTAYRKEDLSEM